ncbi:mycothiol synthase [Dactylosporangium aurantiacum]|uniref:Mycothiol acetyltransferase n=1 Tax=Dactylosporangium aurantiacum TaxID=35754 RepID=A0A9Q9MN05_9ACTN|nr:mycothiol synthase [Dactylosporangium aurantiacum]MDG6100661.1 mycothiol synthase [Dactylosporangium aurantiacum]UWZ55257.1 mycothiol synthase [Dactylosporangium aurantiacum]
MTVERLDHLSTPQIDQVLALSQAAGDTDGALPLSEHVVLHLRHGGEARAVHLLVRDAAGAVIGYAHVDTTDSVAGASAELAVHPQHRRHGAGRALATEVIKVADERAGGRLRLWAHGDHPSASALAVSLGFDRARVLLQLRRSLYAPLDEVDLPEGVTLRAFRPGEDDAAWLAVNAAAFADHPEQGRWTLDDLRVRLREPWFDPEGFLLAFRGDQLVGFHWTKIHGDVEDHAHEPIGEVYVLGVAPGAHGGGLGRALTLAGLWHLRSRGLAQVMLYVDEENRRAVALYQRLGFVRWASDVSFQRSLP